MKKKKAISCILTCALLVSGMGNACVLGKKLLCGMIWREK